MAKGISLKLRNFIDRRHGLTGLQQRKRARAVRMIGDPVWVAKVQTVLAQNEIYLSKYRWSSSEICFPYSEVVRLNQSPYPVNGPLEKIDRLFEEIPWSCRAMRPEPREVGRRSRKHQWSMRVLNSLMGWPNEFLLDAPALCKRTLKVDQRVKWLLDELCTAHPGSYERNFLLTVAKDAGVWPAPDWYRVTRILLGDKRFLKKRK